MCAPTHNMPVTLNDLPMAWLHRMATYLHDESAARLRCTCTLLQQVIDDTWEPVELPVPPHMRSVPLTYQQVEAQLPPAEVCDSKKTYDDPFDEFAEFQDGYIEQDGCHVKWLETYGPALTRLTAHQAINVLKGKSVLCWLGEEGLRVDKFSTTTQRMDDLEELHLLDEIKSDQGVQVTTVVWPPKERSRDCDSDSECECECQGKPQQPWQLGRGSWGWGDDEFGFDVKVVTLEEVRERYTEMQDHYLQLWEPALVGRRPYGVREVELTNGYDPGETSLLVKSDTSCREATSAEIDEFRTSTSEDDVDKFDIYMSHGRDAAHAYVFLAPCEVRVTGQVRPGFTVTPS